MRNKFMAVILSGLMLAGAAVAQTAPQAQQGQKRQWAKGQGMERMAQRLNLTADQQAQIKTLRETQRQKMQALRQDTTLTPEQQAQMQQFGRRAGRHMSFRRGFAAGKMAGALNLTDAQKEQMKPIFQSTRQQMQAVRQDTSLTQEQRRQKMQEIRQSQQAQMKSILTPEQQQKMEQFRNNRRHRGFKPETAPNGF